MQMSIVSRVEGTSDSGVMICLRERRRHVKFDREESLCAGCVRRVERRMNKVDTAQQVELQKLKYNGIL